MSLPPIRAVTFDVDGTLYDFRSLALGLLWRTRGRMRPFRVGIAVRNELRGRDFSTGAAMLEEEARIAAERLDVTPQRARALMDDAFDRVLSECLRAKGQSPARGALEQLVAGGIGIAAVSDRRVDDKLDALGLGDLPWRARLGADDTGALKPSPRPFLMACAALGVTPAEALHVGDRDDTDGEGARRVGMRFAAVRGPADLSRVVREILTAP